MIRIDIDVVINQAVRDVWRSLTDPAQAAMWMSGLFGVSWSPQDRPWGIGTRFLKRQRFVGVPTHMVYETTAFEPNRKLGYKTVSGTLSGPLSYEASITLVSVVSDAVGGDTMLNYHGRGSLRGLFKLAEPLVAWWARRRFQKDFSRFKGLVEAQSGDSGDLVERREQMGLATGGG